MPICHFDMSNVDFTVHKTQLCNLFHLIQLAFFAILYLQVPPGPWALAPLRALSHLAVLKLQANLEGLLYERFLKYPVGNIVAQLCLKGTLCKYMLL